MKSNLTFVLGGGGARGAMQVGALRALAEAGFSARPGSSGQLRCCPGPPGHLQETFVAMRCPIWQRIAVCAHDGRYLCTYQNIEGSTRTNSLIRHCPHRNRRIASADNPIRCNAGTIDPGSGSNAPLTSIPRFVPTDTGIPA